MHFEKASKKAATIHHTMIEPIMLYCAPIYLGITFYHQKIAQIESRACEISNNGMTKPIVSKLNERSATEVFKQIDCTKKNSVSQA